MTLLVNKMLNFKHIIQKSLYHFLLINVSSFCCAKATHNFSANNITIIDSELLNPQLNNWANFCY